MKILVKSLEEQLMITVAEYVSSDGFKRNKAQEFIKPYEWGRAAIHLSFIEHRENFDVTVDVAIRFDALEELVNRDNKLLTAKEKCNTFSIGVELGNYIDNKPLRLTVANDADVHRVASLIYRGF